MYSKGPIIIGLGMAYTPPYNGIATLFLHPCVPHPPLQSLCSACGQKLSNCELIVDKMERVSRKLHLLDKQLDALDVRTT